MKNSTWTPMTIEQCKAAAAERKAATVVKARAKQAKRDAERAYEASKSQLQVCIETVMMINDYSEMISEIAINKVYEIQGVADKANNQFVYDVCASILKYKKASEKQAYVISKFITA